MAESWARVRWKPSMGRAVAISVTREAKGESVAWRLLRRVAMIWERVVFPRRGKGKGRLVMVREKQVRGEGLPEPGIPAMAITVWEE